MFTWNDFTKADETDKLYKQKIINTLSTHLAGKKQTTFTDYVVKLFSALPYIMLIVAVLMIIGIFAYLLNIWKFSILNMKEKNFERFVAKEN